MGKRALIRFEDKTCPVCGVLFNRRILSSGKLESTEDYRVKIYCSHKCYGIHNSGKNNHKWRGGIRHRPDGYLRISSNDKYLHRKIMEDFIGRPLLASENIHHINGDNSDNRLENMVILTNSAHRKLHALSQIKDKVTGRFIKIG
jgi:hypothetical protein